MLASSSAGRLQRTATRQLKRAIHDITVSGGPKSKPIISYGPPGRSAVSGHVATVFGCTGFLGRYVVAKLAKIGTQVIVPYRDEDEIRVLKPMGDLGQIVPLEWDIRNIAQIEQCLRHSDTVYNLVGRDYPTKNFSYTDVHVTGASTIAKVAADNGVSRFVHVSHLNADHDSPSELYRAKAAGEEAVTAAFPDATILRPSAMFGHEDKLLNSVFNWPIWFKLNDMQTKVRPVHVLDVAQAAANLLSTPAHAGALNLPGPRTVTYEYLLDLVSTVTYRPPSKAPHLPKSLAKLVTGAVERAVWWSTTSPDEIERKYIDDKAVPGDWDVVGVEPDDIEQFAVAYLRAYREAETYSRPMVLPHSRM
ncbi:NAD(P)-binding protein [Punctularia strigosozonata HHB-11173 SS5]|uniref:NAD(P)-binding protein n=1 Tax=Punctularia strigosozonata (strain HHB-11173) TaxID=741275 RepID=UPI000441797D|nr:NAD(P)-binding protein [Punctularia strigosozonata HHB-11173 SS5]EIN12372.1 NAD(P)-binding protein [Punctularia strigosozonata HHB-11173 SS5]